jgi:hypothetical protein
MDSAVSAATEQVEETEKAAAVGTEADDTATDPTKAVVDEAKKIIKPKAAIEGC